MYTEDSLLKWNQSGLIPGPKESDASFFKRLSALSPSEEKTTVLLFDLTIDWAQVIYGNKGLAFWEGGATWITEDRAFIQIKKNMNYYSPQEILNHELVHLVRNQFNEPKFEEFFAYMTSPKKWRRFLGPLFESPKEVYFFCMATFLPLFHFYGIFATLGICFWFFWRLLKKHSTLSQCTKKIIPLTKNNTSVWPLLMRLSDEEILFFSKATQEEATAFINEKKQFSLRWKMNSLAYLR